MLCIALFCATIKANQLLPIREKKGLKWSIVDNKGKILLKEYFDGSVSESGEGTFTVRDSTGKWSVYTVEKGKPHLVVDSLENLGNFSEGVMAVVRVQGEPIEIIDKQGKTVLTLDTICGKTIVRCGYCHYGRFVVTTIDKAGDVKVGMVDREGRVIVEPEYEELYACAKGMYCGRRQSKDKTHTEVVIPYGRNEYVVNSSDKETYRVGNYAILPFEDNTIILDLSDIKKRLSLPAGIKVKDVSGKFVSFVKGWEAFVYNSATKQTLSFAGSGEVVLTKKAFLSLDIDWVNAFSLKGKSLRTLEYLSVIKYNDFLIANIFDSDNSSWTCNLLDNKFRPMMKNNCEEINVFPETGYEYSPRRRLDLDFAISIMTKNLRVMVDSGAVAGRNRKDCPLKSKTLFDVNDQTFDYSLSENKDGAIKEAFIDFSEEYTNTDPGIYFMLLNAAVKTEMDKMFKKISDGVYEDNGVFYHIEGNDREIIIYISESPDYRSIE